MHDDYKSILPGLGVSAQWLGFYSQKLSSLEPKYLLLTYSFFIEIYDFLEPI